MIELTEEQAKKIVDTGLVSSDIETMDDQKVVDALIAAGVTGVTKENVDPIKKQLAAIANNKLSDADLEKAVGGVSPGMTAFLTFSSAAVALIGGIFLGTYKGDKIKETINKAKDTLTKKKGKK